MREGEHHCQVSRRRRWRSPAVSLPIGELCIHAVHCAAAHHGLIPPPPPPLPASPCARTHRSLFVLHAADRLGSAALAIAKGATKPVNVLELRRETGEEGLSQGPPPSDEEHDADSAASKPVYAVVGVGAGMSGAVAELFKERRRWGSYAPLFLLYGDNFAHKHRARVEYRVAAAAAAQGAADRLGVAAAGAAGDWVDAGDVEFADISVRVTPRWSERVSFSPTLAGGAGESHAELAILPASVSRANLVKWMRAHRVADASEPAEGDAGAGAGDDTAADQLVEIQRIPVTEFRFSNLRSIRGALDMEVDVSVEMSAEEAAALDAAIAEEEHREVAAPDPSQGPRMKVVTVTDPHTPMSVDGELVVGCAVRGKVLVAPLRFFSAAAQ